MEGRERRGQALEAAARAFGVATGGLEVTASWSGESGGWLARVESPRGPHALKIYGRGRAFAQAEAALSGWPACGQLAPELRGSWPQLGAHLFEWIEDEGPGGGDGLRVWSRRGEALARLHAMRANAATAAADPLPLDGARRARSTALRERAGARGLSVEGPLPGDRPETETTHRVACHRDPRVSNWVSARGRARLLDWEHAGWDAREVDLCAVVEACASTPQAWPAFRAGYGPLACEPAGLLAQLRFRCLRSCLHAAAPVARVAQARDLLSRIDSGALALDLGP